MQRLRTMRRGGDFVQVCLLAVVATAVWASGGEASAQIFGARRPSSFGASATTSDTSTTTGQLQGNERFVRRNRAPGTFVGNDPRQRQGFIGQQSLRTGRVRAAAEMARVQVAAAAPSEAASTVNRATGMYAPRLSVGFDFDHPTDAQVTEDTALQLRLTRAFPTGTRIEVSVADGIATLRGAVLSERDRTLAEQLVLFEPGIAGVRNELRVTPAAPSVQPAPKTPPKPPAKS